MRKSLPFSKGGVAFEAHTFALMAVLVALVVMLPNALAQNVAPGDDDPYSPEQNVVVVGHDELQQKAAHPRPQQLPPPLVAVPGQGLPKTGGAAVGSLILPAGALLLGLGIVAYGVVHKGGSRGGRA